MSVTKVSDNEFGTKVAESEKTVVKFYADWCGSCKLFAPKFKRLSDDPRYKDITFLDVNAEENPEARKVAQVNNLPSFAIFEGGKLVDTISASKEEAVTTLLDRLSKTNLYL
ncbi:MAG: thioredoxin family protein [Bacteroidota bacterium]